MLKPATNPKREKKAKIGILKTSTCNIINAIPIAKDNRTETSNLLTLFTRSPLITPKKMVVPKNMPFKTE